MVDFYASFHLNKKHLGLTNKKIAEKVDMTADALRMAIQNKSLKPKQIKRIEKYFNWHKSRLNTDEKP